MDKKEYKEKYEFKLTVTNLENNSKEEIADSIYELLSNMMEEFEFTIENIGGNKNEHTKI